MHTLPSSADLLFISRVRNSKLRLLLLQPPSHCNVQSAANNGAQKHQRISQYTKLSNLIVYPKDNNRKHQIALQVNEYQNFSQHTFIQAGVLDAICPKKTEFSNYLFTLSFRLKPEEQILFHLAHGLGQQCGTRNSLRLLVFLRESRLKKGNEFQLFSNQSHSF